ncbi:hypothetical protein Asfd1_90 [Aeromonas phage Asfd_1]|nr:hypothetical protein Asfd1_90 [Aeromonas phage Asfd_1]
MNKDIPIGTKVRLSEDMQWAKCASNPIDIDGIIIEPDGRHWTNVQWSNGEWNAYKNTDSDLIIVNDE